MLILQSYASLVRGIKLRTRDNFTADLGDCQSLESTTDQINLDESESRRQDLGTNPRDQSKGLSVMTLYPAQLLIRLCLFHEQQNG